MTSIRALLFALTTAALASLAVVAHGQDAPKIGYVNFPLVVDRAPQTQEVMVRLRDEFAPRQRELVAMQTELQEKQETYNRDSTVMGESERVALERELRDGARDFQRANEELQEDFNIRQNEELGVLQRTLVQQVQEFVRNAGYDLVVTDVVYVSESIDITDEVIAALQARTGANSE